MPQNLREGRSPIVLLAEPSQRHSILRSVRCSLLNEFQAFRAIDQVLIHYCSLKFLRFMVSEGENRLIFCINSGRCGSKFLSKLLGTAEHVTSFHEAEPKMIGEYLQWINERTYEETVDQRRIKANEIQNILNDSPPQAIYCETNHMFIKTFFDVVVDAFGDRMEVILLRRNLAAVLKSFMELGYFSDKNQVWPNWMSSPNAVTAAIPCIGEEESLDQCDRCIAYLIDIEARALRFCRDYSHINVHPIRLETLNTLDNSKLVLQKLGLTATNETETLYSESSNFQINHKRKRKQDLGLSTTIEYCHERIQAYLEKAALQGIELPKTLALN